MNTLLTSVEDLLRPILAPLESVRSRNVATADAVSLYLAVPVLAGQGLPPHAVALRSGLAVRSLDLVGASPHTPVLLTPPPQRVRVGERLPDGCNAVIDPEELTLHGGFAEATESVAPGTHVRLVGHDVALGLMLTAARKRMTPELALACTEAGVEHVDVAAAAVHVSLAPGPVRAWLDVSFP